MNQIQEEYVDRGKLTQNGNNYEMVIDFSKVEQGSDLWVWYQVVDFSENNVEILMTPRSKPANLYYEIGDKKIIFKGDTEVEFSYRLTGKRFDWKNYPTQLKDLNLTGGIEVKMKK
jgi:hypothetical protein